MPPVTEAGFDRDAHQVEQRRKLCGTCSARARTRRSEREIGRARKAPAAGRSARADPYDPGGSARRDTAISPPRHRPPIFRATSPRRSSAAGPSPSSPAARIRAARSRGAERTCAVRPPPQTRPAAGAPGPGAIVVGFEAPPHTRRRGRREHPRARDSQPGRREASSATVIAGPHVVVRLRRRIENAAATCSTTATNRSQPRRGGRTTIR